MSTHLRLTAPSSTFQVCDNREENGDESSSGGVGLELPDIVSGRDSEKVHRWVMNAG